MAADDTTPAGLLAEGAAVLLAVCLGLVGLLLPAGSLLRVFLTLPLLVFLPGYALTTVLFPARDRAAVRDAHATTWSPSGGTGSDSQFATDGDGHQSGTVRAGVSGVERLALSFGFSVALVPLAMMGLWTVAQTVALGPFLALLVPVVVLATGLGVLRRLRMPRSHRYELRFLTGSARRNTASGPGSGRAVQAVLVVSVVLLLASFGTAALGPLDGTAYTGFALLTEGQSGELIAGDYPDELTVNGTQEVVFEVENDEQRTTEYTVVAALHRVENGTVVETSRLETFGERVEPGERWRVPHDPSRLVEPDSSLSGPGVQLTYLLYRGDPPAEPTRENAYRSLYIGVDVGAALEGEP